MRRGRATVMVLAVLTIAGSGAPVVPSDPPVVQAADETTTIDEWLGSVGVDAVPPAVRERLQRLLRWAQAEGAWPPTPSVSAWPGAVQHWRDVAPEWRQAAEGLGEQHRQCRAQAMAVTTSATMPTCARLLAAQLRVRHAERLVAMLGERQAEAAQLPEPARTRVGDALDQVRERATERLRELETLDAPEFDGEPDLDRDRVRERLRDLEGLGGPSTTQIAPSSSGPPSTGRGDDQQQGGSR